MVARCVAIHLKSDLPACPSIFLASFSFFIFHWRTANDGGSRVFIENDWYNTALRTATKQKTNVSRNKRAGGCGVHSLDTRADAIHLSLVPAGHHRAFVLWRFANKRKMDPTSNRTADSAHRVTHYSRKRAVLNNPGQRIISRKCARACGITLNSRPPESDSSSHLEFPFNLYPAFSRSLVEGLAVNITACPLCR